MTSIARVPSTVLRDAVLRSLQYQARSLRAIQSVISSHPSENVERMLDKLQAAGFVTFKLKLYALTKKGRNALPTANILASHGRYTPPRVVRRPGTEIHRSLPSMRGGRLHYPPECP